MEKACLALRERIISGEYAPGTRLKERKICEELAMSRTPVREALRRLAADGLVTIEPRRGAVVTAISADEANEIYSLGAVLESFAAKLAATRASGSELAELERLLDAMRPLVDSPDTAARSRYMELDSRFHRAILAMAGNRRLTAVLQQIVRIPVLVQAFHRYSDDDLRQSFEQHRAIAAAIAAGEPEWAETAMRAHVLAARSIRLPADAAN